MAARKKPAAKKPTRKPAAKKNRIPKSSEYKAAQQALIAADLYAFESDRSRLSGIAQGSYTGGPVLRSGGTAISSRYRIGQPKPDKGYANYFGIRNRKPK